MTVFILSRHGESAWHSGNRYAGRTDIPLTPRGEEQGRQLARWAAAASLTAVWSSTLSRAERTASESALSSGLTLHTDARLCELDFGRGEGLTATEMEAQFPDDLAAFHKDPVARHLPGGENPVKAAARFREALEDISRQQPEGRVLVVAHSTVLRLALCSCLGISLSEYRRVFPRLDNTSLTELRFIDGHSALITYNAPCLSEC